MLPPDLQGLRQIFVTLAIHRLCCIILLTEVFFYPHCAVLFAEFVVWLRCKLSMD